ncbi:tetratricopeptide repeat protein 38 [Octopus bimaculoides]|uniref:Tetratricopeptide repeat protein 38 n=1 Tax=Octopus bimaculoides TaxID=37653 RepID=A0A0L8GKU6_OCTBM|nr:tetratricopeptide repeat protein 38 [Octopus bimaculoides]XP_014780200.1 tetratricopeptide repeat protein 38 [Octopus bimaculoides]XP_014780201.1 tetratricopeptide repeat protein 38 [Octopus bimaculoides]XP_014780202.1 tetratricopeptide repeat protein 38 [Octopus bimaculoides]|eukprot:XP_014780199.1 PREDICTED: tetratricopeptide repeat protein 38-like [Octopus bimaculoides]
MYYQWRDKQAWKTFGIDLSSPSDEACKLFDINLNQLVRFCNDEAFGGIATTTTKMFEADPDFIMGHVFQKGLAILSPNQNLLGNSSFQEEVKKLKALSKTATVTPWEALHVDAIECGAKGDLLGACKIWQDILVETPLDILALKLSQFANYFLGKTPQLLHSVASVLSHWTPSVPNHGYVHGMMAFGLEENNMYEEAEKEAAQSLSINKTDIWASHAKGHVWEMQGEFEKGIDYFDKTEKDWSSCDMLTYHVYWHWAVYHIERGDYSSAMEIYKKGFHPDVSGFLAIKDAASLLYRLGLEDIDCSKEWKAVFNLCHSHMEDHFFIFQDIHILMALLSADEMKMAQEFTHSMTSGSVPTSKYFQKIVKEVGKAVCEALVAYKEGDYADVVELLMPIQFQLREVGGSNAQRDVLNLLLIVSAMKSPREHHQKLARYLLNERKTLRKNSPLTDRLILRSSVKMTN